MESIDGYCTCLSVSCDSLSDLKQSQTHALNTVLVIDCSLNPFLVADVSFVFINNE